MQLIRSFMFAADAFVDKQAFGGMTWGQVLLILFALVMGWIVWGFLSTSSRKPEPDTRTVVALCLSCGWRGRVNRHALVCPNCGDDLEVQ